MRAVFLKTQFLLAASLAVAGTPAIGIITASGHFTLGNSMVWGNSTLFDGVTVETEAASSQVALRSGAKLELGAASKARVFANRAELQKGVGIAAGSYEIDARGLKIRAEGSRLRVTVTDRVEIASLSGVARVTGAAGFLLAAIPAGHAMSFSPQAAATGAVTRTGCLVYKDGHFLLQDENTQEVSEVTGPDAAMQQIRANVGNRVEIGGAMTAAKPGVAVATGVLTAASVKVQSSGGCLSVASALDARTDIPAGANAPGSTTPPGQTPAASSGGHGMSTGTKILIVAAIGGAGAGAALALAGKKSSTSP